MKVVTSSKAVESVVDEALVIPIFEGVKPSKDLSKDLQKALLNKDFKAEQYEVYLSYHESFKSKRVIYVSLGKEESVTLEKIRRAYHQVQKKLNSLKIKSFSLSLPKTKLKLEEVTDAILTSILLSNYRFDKYKSDDKDKGTRFSQITVLDDNPKLKNVIDHAVIVAKGANFVRDLANENARDKTSLILEDIARKTAKENKLKITVFDEKDLKRLGMNLLLAVGAGAVTPPRLIVLEYHGNPSSKDVYSFVGKGIIFDSGGLNLKPTGSIEDMRADMTGAATVLGLLRVASQLKIKANLVGVMAVCENAISNGAYKPGDIFRSYSGKTVYIGNTDAEGRLILADALSYSIKKYKPKLTVDMATLTGAAVVAVGTKISAILGNNEKAINNIISSGKKVGENFHELPLFEDYNELMKNNLADISNISSEKFGPGTITAALFLQNFVDNQPWVHLDIAGPAFISSEYHYVGPQATGVCVRTLINFLENI
ncbi:MAG: leucyl aminopeptidase [Nanoarchaeota archaeon]